MKRLEPVYAMMDEKIGQIQDSQMRWYSDAHAHGVAQISVLLAMKRGLRADIAAATGLLHDISAVLLGTYQQHAELGAGIARVFLKELGTFSAEEIEIIASAIAAHDRDPRQFTGYDAILSEADFLEPFLRTQQPPKSSSGRRKLEALLAELGIIITLPEPPDGE